MATWYIWPIGSVTLKKLCAWLVVMPIPPSPVLTQWSALVGSIQTS